jgi:ATP-dependent DNA helicase RecG
MPALTGSGAAQRQSATSSKATRTRSFTATSAGREAIVAAGEGSTVEFKAKLPADARESIRRAIKAVPAFANGAGGVLVFGIDDDSGTVIGLTDLSREAIESRLINLVHDNVHPVPSFHVKCHEIDGKLLASLTVDAGTSKPYALFQTPPQFYIRHGSNSFPATREELMSLSVRWENSLGRSY